MKSKELNQSSAKTKTLIRATFAELFEEKHDIAKVTVSELTQRAHLSRSTFYLHYDNINDVAEDFQSEILDTLLLDRTSLKTPADVDAYFDHIINFLKEHEEIYRMIATSKNTTLYLSELSDQIKEKVYAGMSSQRPAGGSQALRFRVGFFVDGILAQVLSYFTGDTPYSLDDINDYMKVYFKILFL